MEIGTLLEHLCTFWLHNTVTLTATFWLTFLYDMYDCDKRKLKNEIAACVSVYVCTAELCRDVLKKKKNYVPNLPVKCTWWQDGVIDIYIYIEFQLEAYWFEPLRRKKKPWKKQKIKTSNIFVLIKLGKVPLSSQKQTYHSFTYFYPVKTGKNPVVDTHLCKYGRCNQVTKNPLIKIWLSLIYELKELTVEMLWVVW